MLITYQVEVDVNDVWEKMMGGSSGYWADDFKRPDDGVVDWYVGTEYEPNPQDFRVLADGAWHTVTVRSIAEAYVKLKQDSWTHCGGYSVEDNDACVGDAILQVAAFGEFVYG
jgi:hypothetical protein